MTSENRDIQRKLKVLRHAKKTGHVAMTCRVLSCVDGSESARSDVVLD